MGKRVSTETIAEMATKLDEQKQRAEPYRMAVTNGMGPVYMSKESRKHVDQKLTRLGVNYPRLYVKALADRLNIAAFRKQGSTELDADLWARFVAAGLRAGSEITHSDYLTYGESYVTLWAVAGAPDTPTVMYDNPLTAYVETDPATGAVTRALRRWQARGKHYAALLEPGGISRYEGREQAPVTAPATWNLVEEIPNPWDEVPLVRFARKTTATDVMGESVLDDVMPLTAAHAKVLQDAIVTSEEYARPRRWVTGLEIEYDDDGNPVDPFGDQRLLQSESPETRFGQFDSSRLDGYGSLLDTLTTAVAAVTGLPAHYLGIDADQAVNAESIRAAEAQIVAQAYTEQNRLSDQWAIVAGWLRAIGTGANEISREYRPRYDDAETRTPAQAADAAMKLAAIGVPLEALLDDPLRMEPHKIRDIMRNRENEALMKAAYELGGQ